MSTTTVRMKAANIYKDWHVIDAADRPLGRVATEAARLIRGKHKPTYEPHLDDGDFVIVINASKVRLTGNKAEQKRYYRHSGYPGALKERTFEQMMAAFPERVIEQAVWGMLPSGRLGRAMIKHLKVYRGPDHPHQSQVLGSERARQARETALADQIAAGQSKKPPRLRPLPIPADVAAAAAAAAATLAETEAPAPAPAAREEPEPAAVEAAPVAVIAPATEAPEDAETAPEEAETATEEAEQPKPARRSRSRKTDETELTEESDATAEAPEAEAEAEAEEKPRRRRRKAEASAEQDDAEAASDEASTEEEKDA